MSIDVGMAVVRTVLRLDGSTARRVSKEAESALTSSMRKAGAAMSTAGAGLTTGVTLPILGAATAGIKMASDFEKSMLLVKAATEAPADEMAAMEKRARELGASTIFSSKEAADGMAALGLAGFKTNDIMKSIGGTLQLAATDNIDLATASSITAKALNGFGLSAEQAGRVADVLAKASVDTTSSSTELGMALKYSASNARSAGLSIEQTTAALGLLANAGLDGSTAGTSLNIMLSSLQQPTKKLQTQFKKFGIELRDGSGNLRSLEDIFGQVAKAGPDAMSQISLAMEERAGRAFRALGTAGPDAIGKLTTSLENSEGTAKRVADTLTGGTSGAMEELSSAIEGLAITIANSGLLQSFTDIVRKITDFIRRISESNPELLKIGVVVLGVAAAIGPLLVALGAVVSAAGVLAPVLTGVGAALGAIGLPVLAVVAGVAALGAALVLAYKNSKPFRDFVNGLWENLKAFGAGFAAGFLDKIRPAVTLFQTEMMPAIQELGSVFATVWSNIENTLVQLQPVLDTITPYVQKFGELLGGALGEQARRAFSVISGSFKGIAKVIGGVVKTISGIFSGDLTKTLEGLVDIGQGMVDGFLALIGAFAPGLRDALTKAFDDAVDALKDLLGIHSPSTVFRNMARDTLQGFVNGVVATIGRVVSAFRQVNSRIVRTIRGVLGDVLSLGRDIAYRVASGIANGVGRVTSKARDIKNRVVNALSGIGSRMVTVGRNIVGGVIDGIRNRIGSLAQTAANMAASALNAAKNFLGIASPSKVFRDIGRNVGDGMALGMRGRTGEVARAATDMARGSLVGANGTVGAVGRGVAGVVQNFYGPQTGQARLQELEWTMRYATSARVFGDPAVAL